MKNIITLFFLTVAIALNCKGQVIDGIQDKLFDQFLLGKYGDCYAKAIKMTESEKYKSDPEPYLYVSMCLVKLVEDPAELEFRSANLKDAFKYAEKSKKYHAKCLKKDIATFPMEENLEFFDELAMLGVEESKYYFYEDKFSKSASWFKKTAKIAPEDDNLQFAMAASMLLSRNMEGQKIMDEVLPRMKEKYSNGDQEPSQVTRDALVVGFLAYSKYLVDNGETSKAKEIINFGHELMPDNRKITAKWEEITQ